MRKVERRTFVCIILTSLLFFGLCFFVGRLAINGEDWAVFKGNTQVYSEGLLNRGNIYDRNGELLLSCSENGISYSDNQTVRMATVHIVGDLYGNISTGMLQLNADDLIGYDFVNGIYSVSGEGENLNLTIDAKASEVAYNALGYRDGFVGVFNYETGEILCIVNKPSFDPVNGTSDTDGVYFNKFMQGKMIPGSTFKLLTSAAAIDNIEDLDEFEFYCDGSSEMNGSVINCTYAHGNVDFYSALAKSCNGAFAILTAELGAEEMEKYVEKTGLTTSYNVSGIYTEPSSFEFPDNNDVNLGWAGIGQYNDQLNPCAMMIYIGAIANGGEAVNPMLLNGGTDYLGSYLSEETADELSDMMKNNVIETYGESNFEGLDIYAKSGTAETGNGSSDAWFVGFIKNENHPYAFVVCVENGGSGSTVAGPVADKVLESLVN